MHTAVRGAVDPRSRSLTAFHGLGGLPEEQYSLAPKGSGLIMRLVLADSRIL
jgi:hypothetical protein